MKTLEGLIEYYTRGVVNGKEQWEEFEEAQQLMDYDGAGNYFGHADDCFDAGTEYGQYLEMIETLNLLETLKENNG